MGPSAKAILVRSLPWLSVVTRRNWRADERVEAAASDRAADLNAFQADLDLAQDERPNAPRAWSSDKVQPAGPQITRVLRTALLDTQLWDGREPLAPVISSVTDYEEKRERLFRAWCETKGVAHVDREAVLRAAKQLAV